MNNTQSMGRRTQVIMYLNKNVLSRQLRVCATKRVFCRDKSMFVVKKGFVATNCVCRDIYLFVAKNCFSRQIFVAKHIFVKHNFVATSILLLSQKTCFVVTNTCLSGQTSICRD